jgi:hypothetical protein
MREGGRRLRDRFDVMEGYPLLRLGAWDLEVCTIKMNLNDRLGVHRHWREAYRYHRGQ